MKVTYNWLKDFVDIRLSPEALAEKLTMAGLEVKSIEHKDNDAIFEIEITSNRPDWLNVSGIAREVAAITNAKLRVKGLGLRAQARRCGNEKLFIKIENKKDCPLYTAKIIRDVKVGSSPEWLRKRLELIGCRSINNIVDATNYIMFTWGEPLHAFDLDKVGNNIVVRRAKNKEKIITIDESERQLGENILVIADTGRPVAIAGVMGGKDTEVSEKTKNILLEAAVFNPVVVRRGRQRLGLQSESSYRFERGMDIETAQESSEKTVQLILELAGGSLTQARAAGTTKIPTRRIALSVATAQKTLGINIPATKMKQILLSLDLKVKARSKNSFSVDIPSRRQDLFLGVDLIEEIARVFGYEKIPTTLPAVRPVVHAPGQREMVSSTKTILVGLGLYEAITYSLIDRDLLKGLSKESQASSIAILNPLSKEQEILRPSLLASLGRCVALNLNQKQEYVSIFEIAHAFIKTHPLPKEELFLAVALCGKKQLFLSQGAIKEDVGLLDVKGVIEVLFDRLGIEYFNFVAEGAHSIGVYIDKERIGNIQQLDRVDLEALDIKNKDVFGAELNLEKIFAAASGTKRFLPPPRYPEVSRDISVVLKDEISTQEVIRTMQEKGSSLLRAVRIADYYKGKQIPQGTRGITLSCVYRSDERTLTESEVTPLHSALVALLKEKFGVQIR